MSIPTWTRHPPQKVLLATDLSGRCDRALDRAVQLAGEWGARLAVVHVLDPAESFIEKLFRDDEPSWRRPPERALLAENQLRRDLPAAVGHVDLRIEEGEPAAIIDRVARELGADLIVTGVARDEILGRVMLGTTVNRLARRTPVPMLVVKSRAHPYERVLAATDFSDSSRLALLAALAYCPLAQVILLHTFEAPYLHTGEDLSAQFLKMALDSAGKFLDETALTPEQRRRITIQVKHGSPEAVIRRLMQEQGLRLVVLGSHGHSAAFDVLLGSTARRVLESAPGDVLLIREPKAVDLR